MKVCPTCLRELPQPERRRICSKCNERIRKRHRWKVNTSGRMEHIDCTNPEHQQDKTQQELIP